MDRNHKRYGNNWAAIGRKIGVAPQLARDKYRNMTDRQRTGRNTVGSDRGSVAFYGGCGL